ncbi:MAG: lipase family protein [Nocardioides sp.]
MEITAPSPVRTRPIALTAVVLAIGIGSAVLGVWLMARPLSALAVLGVWVGAGAIASGVADLVSAGRQETLTRILGGVWVLAGLAVLIWLGHSITLFVPSVALLMIVSGAGKVAGLWRTRERRWLTAVFGVAEIAWGLLALVWPDMTLIVLAFLFGLRTTLWGLGLAGRAAGPLITPLISRVLATRWLAERVTTHPPRARSGRAARWWLGLRWLGAVLVVSIACAGLYAGTLMWRGVPVLDDFYDTPAHVPHTPGRLLRSEPYDGVLPTGMHAYRILYTTTGSTGQPALASGVVAVPDHPVSAEAPVIAWAHGTVGIARSCAPSNTDYAITYQGMPAMDALARHGWAMVATDYTGMGAAGTFPYLVGKGEGYSVLDSVRAANQVPGVHLAARTVIWGHSQGGHAALWAGQLAPSYAPDLDVVGTAALSPAADPRSMAEAVVAHPDRLGASLAISFVAASYARTYPDVDLDRIVTPSARVLVREAASRCTGETGTLATILSGLAIARDQPILRESPSSGVLARRLEENVATGPWPSPLFVGQGSADEVVPLRITDAYVERVCAAGASVEQHTYAGGTHMSVLDAGAQLSADLERWTAARLAGRPATSSCG